MQLEDDGSFGELQLTHWNGKKNANKKHCCSGDTCINNQVLFGVFQRPEFDSAHESPSCHPVNRQSCL